MKKLTTDINLDAEVVHLANFIRKKWSPISNLDQLFTAIRDEALHNARAWFESHDIWTAAGNMEDARKELLQRSLNLPEDTSADLYDAICTLLNHVGRDARDLAAAGTALDGEWYFGDRAEVLYRQLTATYPDLMTARPLGWDELERDYHDFIGQEEYDPGPDFDLFEGVAVKGTLSGEFTYRVALPYVLYDERCQGRIAASVLVGAVFAHFLGIAKFLNTQKLLQDLATAIPQIAEPTLLFERKVSTTNPVLQAAFKLAPASPSKEDYEEHLSNKAAFEALSDEEKSQRKADNAAHILEMLKRLKANADAERQEWQAQEQLRIQMLREAFIN